MTSLLLGVPHSITPSSATSGVIATVALPARPCYLAVELTYDEAPNAIDIDVEVAISEAGPWTLLDGSTEVNGEVLNFDGAVINAKFARLNVQANTDPVEISAKFLARPAA